MSRYQTTDLLWTEDGDIALDASGDFALASGNDLIEQNIKIAVRTTNPDWESDAIGADMEDMIGMENTRETASLGSNKIMSALTRSGFFDEEDIWIEAKPTSTSTIVYFVFINSPFSELPLIYQVNLDLGFGSTVRRVQ